MKHFLISLIVFATGSLVLADSLPNRQRRMSIYHLSKSQVGQELIQSLGSEEILHEVLRFDAIEGRNQLKLFQTQQTDEGYQLVINAEILASSYIYMSWVLSQAIAEYRLHQIEMKYGVELPRFIEFTQWSMNFGRKYWRELRYPNQYDLATDPNPDFSEVALRLRASTTELTRFYRSNFEGFLSKAKTRHIALAYPDIHIADYIKSKPEGPHKRAAIELEQRIKEELLP